MKTYAVMILGVLTLGFYACKDDDADRIEDPVNEPVELNYSFNSGDDGWDAGLANFLLDEEDLYGFNVEQTTAPFDEEEGVLVLSASNPNDDLFMYASKQITGLDPNTQYSVNYRIELASVMDTTGTGTDTLVVDTTDIGTAVSDSVYIKAGAASEEPVTDADDLDFLQLVGIDVGEPGEDGNDLIVIGAVPADSSEEDAMLHSISTDTPVMVETNDDGELWLIIGVESFASATEIYINSIEVEIEK